MAANFLPRSASLFDWDFGFQGQVHDAETGWYNYGYRFYVPPLGRWINRDPIQERGGTNLYLFSRSQPMNLFDALGLYPVDPPSNSIKVVATITCYADVLWECVCATTGDRYPDSQLLSSSGEGGDMSDPTYERPIIEDLRKQKDNFVPKCRSGYTATNRKDSLGECTKGFRYHNENPSQALV
jgi:RHS repeat-associated protein